MYCKKCGTELRENDTFCYYCGNRIGWMQRMLSSKDCGFCCYHCSSTYLFYMDRENYDAVV